MPSTIVHSYIGVDTLNILNEKPKKIIQDRINNYKIYCQNMDVLYFYHILLLIDNKIQKLGYKFHNENVYNCFEMLINDNKKNKDLELFTFIAGIITHYKADTIIHPFVNYIAKTNGSTKRNDIHFVMEAYLDNYYINKFETKDYDKHNHSKLIFNYQKEKIIEDEITKIFNQFWNYPNMGKKYYQALKEMHFVFKYLRYDKHGIKRFLYSILDLNPFNIKRCKYLSYHFKLDKGDLFLNNNHQKWHYIDHNDKTSNKSFEELYDMVINESSNIINQLYEYIFENKKIDLKKIIGNLSYSTGLPINEK